MTGWAVGGVAEEGEAVGLLPGGRGGAERGGVAAVFGTGDGPAAVVALTGTGTLTLTPMENCSSDCPSW